MQHDAHEFFNHLLNSIHVVLLEEKKAERERRRLLEQQAFHTSSIKKDRSSFFHRSKKTKSLKSKKTPSKINDNSANLDNSSTGGAVSEEVAEVEEADDLLKSSGRAASEPKLNVDETPPESNINNSTKTFSLLSRMRHSKKASTSSKSSDENENLKIPPTIEEDAKDTTWIYDIFQGTYTTITRCLNCETVS